MRIRHNALHSLEDNWPQYTPVRWRLHCVQLWSIMLQTSNLGSTVGQILFKLGNSLQLGSAYDFQGRRSKGQGHTHSVQFIYFATLPFLKGRSSLSSFRDLKTGIYVTQISASVFVADSSDAMVTRAAFKKRQCCKLEIFYWKCVTLTSDLWPW